MSRTVTADRLGAWLLKINPRVTDLGRDPGRALATLTERCVRPGYRLDLVRPGQPVLLWVSGGGGVPSGIHAAGVVTSLTRPAGGVPAMGIRVAALETPLLREDLRTDPRLESLEVLRMPFGSNPSWVSHDELAELHGTWGLPAIGETT